MLMALFVAKLLDIVGFFMAGVMVLFIKSKWGIVISGATASVLTIIVVQLSGRNIPADIMGAVFFAGIIAHSIHAGIIYYTKHLIIKKRILAKDEA
ncbi:hypothetical protein [Halomonas sp. I5-271120]|uniref:hypothetical protein n=1 Tax=Halomonas sp. I5-271120 TaxID=3061632 RepID=UPI002714BC0E|nr:hypothetical protein [Halomonas sp. I5-271120]